jgi:hypothetical protein
MALLVDPQPLTAIDPEIWRWCAIGLGGAFTLTVGVLLAFMRCSTIDHGFLGLMLLISLVVFAVTFSFLVAAATPGVAIKVAIVVIEGLLALGTKLLSARFLDYLES